jgi:hypothetical protein
MLKEKQSNIEALLAATKPTLPEPERIEVEEAVRALEGAAAEEHLRVVAEALQSDRLGLSAVEMMNQAMANLKGPQALTAVEMMNQAMANLKGPQALTAVEMMNQAMAKLESQISASGIDKTLGAFTEIATSLKYEAPTWGIDKTLAEVEAGRKIGNLIGIEKPGLDRLAAIEKEYLYSLSGKFVEATELARNAALLAAGIRDHTTVLQTEIDRQTREYTLRRTTILESVIDTTAIQNLNSVPALRQPQRKRLRKTASPPTPPEIASAAGEDGSGPNDT